MKLAIAYTIVALNAAVGTDQDCSTFWSKIRDVFFNKGGGVERTPNSLQNRFNKVLSYKKGKRELEEELEVCSRVHRRGPTKVLM
jgi:hypothetical protein